MVCAPRAQTMREYPNHRVFPHGSVTMTAHHGSHLTGANH